MTELDLFAAAIAIADPEERAALLERECSGRPQGDFLGDGQLGRGVEDDAVPDDVTGPIHKAIGQVLRDFVP